MQGDPHDMNPRPASTRLRRALPLAVALAIGAAAGAGAYALTKQQLQDAERYPLWSCRRSPHRPRRPSTRSRSSTSRTRRASSTSPSSRPRAAARPAASPSATPGGSQKAEAEGTGFEINSKGDILTAEHVVDRANSIKVTFQDGSTAKATLVGSDKSTDTAVIHVDVPASQLHPLTLGNSSAAQPGQTVVAIGSPFGLRRDHDRRASSAPPTARSPPRTASRSPARSRPMPPSTTATPAGR